jgi:hypothetical protein
MTQESIRRPEDRVLRALRRLHDRGGGSVGMNELTGRREPRRRSAYEIAREADRMGERRARTVLKALHAEGLVERRRAWDTPYYFKLTEAGFEATDS